MPVLPVLLGLGQECPKCNQRSNPRPGVGNWEIMGVWNGAIHKCTRCMTLVRIGFFSDVVLTAEEADRFLKARRAEISELEEKAKRFPPYYSRPVSEWTQKDMNDMRRRSGG